GAVLVGALAGGLVVVCAAVGSIVVATPRPSVKSVAAVPIPSIPTSLGTRIAYTVPALGPFSVTPAGPGFVVLGRRSVAAYHGETGQRRWVRSFADLPFGCRTVGIWAAGPAGHEVVLVTCSDGGYRNALVGIDAVSGERLWTNAEGWRVRVPGATRASIVGVIVYDRNDRPTTIGALDVRTGHTRWTTPTRECFGGLRVSTTSSAVVAISTCGERPSLVAFHATSGVARTIGLPTSPDSEASIIAVDGDRVATVFERQSIHERKLAIVDVSQKDSVTTVPGATDPPGPGLLMRAGDQARYLQSDWYGTDGRTMSGMVDLRSASFSTIRGADLYPNGIPDEIPVGQRLAAVGDGIVSGVVATTGPNVVAVIAADGQATTRPAPCDKLSGVLPVPGAILMTCFRRDRPNTVNDVVVLGIR
ncbi:PQQ-binding-like beta-propeller repeat protein, partial [Gordonia sp. i37]|uniref:outer membrane protein assembly factor BamB family protein n=1 Tax=Gordonia sp. i37 TaxID=1961707 RepID=UPI0009C68A55